VESYRKCIAIKKVFKKSELIRIVSYQGVIQIDYSMKFKTRGYYLSKSKEALAIIIKQKTLQRVFGVMIDNSLYQQIGELIEQ
jgi:predicted RNA-binding protein YlxR (DUF448 family)